MADNSKSVMIDGHFRLGRTKESRPAITFLTASMLRTSGKDLANKGIKVPAGETFHYCWAAEGSGIYIFEAGFGPAHSETVKDNVYLYITCNEKRYLVGTLSSQHSRIQLNLMMNADFQLMHTAKRKVIFFNAWQFGPVPLKDCWRHTYTRKKFWVREIKPLKGNTIDPMADEKKYHILRVFSGTNIKESIDINVQCRGKFQKIGTISPEDTSLSCNHEYDEIFTLSHTSKAANLLVSGYTVPYFTYLKELPGPPSDEINLKSRKVSADPEYEAFVKMREQKKAGK